MLCLLWFLHPVVFPWRAEKDLIVSNQALTDTHQTIRQTFKSVLILNQIKFKMAF